MLTLHESLFHPGTMKAEKHRNNRSSKHVVSVSWFPEILIASNKWLSDVNYPIIRKALFCLSRSFDPQVNLGANSSKRWKTTWHKCFVACETKRMRVRGNVPICISVLSLIMCSLKMSAGLQTPGFPQTFHNFGFKNKASSRQKYTLGDMQEIANMYIQSTVQLVSRNNKRKRDSSEG